MNEKEMKTINLMKMAAVVAIILGCGLHTANRTEDWAVVCNVIGAGLITLATIWTQFHKGNKETQLLESITPFILSVAMFITLITLITWGSQIVAQELISQKFSGILTKLEENARNIISGTFVVGQAIKENSTETAIKYNSNGPRVLGAAFLAIFFMKICFKSFLNSIPDKVKKITQATIVLSVIFGTIGFAIWKCWPFIMSFRQ